MDPATEIENEGAMLMVQEEDFDGEGGVCNIRSNYLFGDCVFTLNKSSPSLPGGGGGLRKGYYYYYAGGGEVKVACYFFTQPYSLPNLRQYQTIAHLSKQVNHPSLITPLIVSPTPSNDLVAIGYRFDNLFTLSPTPTPFRADNAALNPWWITQIKNILQLIKEMSDKKVCHGSLKDPNSYVISSGNLCVVNPTQRCSSLFKDLIDFRKFLRIETAPGHKSLDWDDFISLFPTVRDIQDEGFNIERRIKQLRNLPVLKEPEERLDYFQVWWDFCRPHGLVLRIILNLNLPSQFNPWNQKLLTETDTVYFEAYQMPEDKKTVVLTYDGYNILDLVRYIRNVVEQFHMSETKKMADIENELRNMFPGYLGYFHSCCAKETSGTFKITEGLG